ncbi:HNH endonuclease [Mycobacteroides chelonae]|uniref:HNH endonuclease n=1 Tax=Mycobacteroides chelonae TaxID=1774 RepID=UPI0009C185D1|nr:HNH endonuclease [Mycobacteroides chelonae]MBF9348750.1 hypothetical protein [Mycobacteroides chelonae]
MSSVNRDATEATSVLTCRDLTHASEPQKVPVAESMSAGGGGRRGGAVVAGAVLLVAAVAGLHGLYRAGGDIGAWGVWVAALLAGMTALGGGIKLIMWGSRPVVAAVSAAGKERLSEPVQTVIAAVAVIAGALGMWWTFRGGYAAWWQYLSGETRWSLLLGIGQMMVVVLAGAALFVGGKYLTGLVKEVLTDGGMLGARDHAAVAEGVGAHRNQSRNNRDEPVWHPGLLAALIAGGAGLVLLAAGITPRLYVWITGPDVFPAAAAITLVLLWAISSNLGWWKGLAGLYAWATDASQRASAVAGVVALLMFSASGVGLGWFTPDTVPQAHAACPPDCGGGGGLDGPPGGGQIFQPPSQGGQQMPDYQGGINQPPMDQNGSVSIYNTQAPSITNNGTQGSSGRQGPQQGWDQPAHGTQIPDYQNATPYTQGPGKPNPDFNPGSQGAQTNPGSNAGSQGGQSNQGVQQRAQQPQQGVQQAPQQQPPQQDAGQQPNQSPDQQKIDDLTKQLQDQQQQSGQDRQRIDDLTKQLQQQGQQKQSGNQKLPKAPSKDKKQDDKDQQDQDDQSGNNDLSALLMGAASTRRRKQEDQSQPDQQQEQGPDTQALAEDGAQLGQSLPGDIANTVSDSVNLGQSAGSAAQNFGSAAQAGASLASSAQSGAVNPMDAVALVQGVSGGISDTADAVGSGASIASTWLNEAGQGAQLAADVNPQLKPQAQQIQQLTQAGGQAADLTGQVAGGVSQVSGMVNTASSLGTSGVPDTSGATDALSGTATAVNGPGDVPTPPTPPSAPSQSSSGVQALDSTTTRAPQQPTPVAPKTTQNNFYKDWYPKQPAEPDPTAGAFTGSLNKMGITEPKSPLDKPAPAPDPRTVPAPKLDMNNPADKAAVDQFRSILSTQLPPDQVDAKVAEAVKGSQQDRPLYAVPEGLPQPVRETFSDAFHDSWDKGIKGTQDLVGANGLDAAKDAWGDIGTGIKSSFGELAHPTEVTPQRVDNMQRMIDNPKAFLGEQAAIGVQAIPGAMLGGEGALARVGLEDAAVSGTRAEITRGLPEPRELPTPSSAGGSTYKQRLDQTPINNGQWTDQRGESTWLSQNPMVNQFLREAGVEGIEYSNARPDFGPVAQGQVEIPNMSTNRDVNFKAADKLLAKQWGVSPQDIADFRKANKYTWHEEPNLTTMQLVPSVVNNRLGHLGGIGELNAGKTLPPIGEGAP